MHHHHTASHESQSRLTWSLGIALTYMAAEVIGGLLSNSLALLADAGHMLSDCAALAISLFAAWMAHRPGTSQRTFGFHRAEILAALFNASLLIAVSISILWEAWQRWRSPPEIDAGLMVLVAVGGLVANLAMLAILHAGRNESLNLRGAWLHVMGDTIGSLAVIVAGVSLIAFGWRWVDPLASVIITVLIAASALRLVRESLDVLMESAPASVSVDDVRDCLLSVPGVRSVHCLHVWRIASGFDSLSAHVVVERDHAHTDQMRRLYEALRRRFRVEHITLQLEPADFTECAPQRQPSCEAE